MNPPSFRERVGLFFGGMRSESGLFSQTPFQKGAGSGAFFMQVEIGFASLARSSVWGIYR